jgi:hypothetical protein
MLAEFNAPHRHTKCSGCPACREDYARVLTLSAAEYCAWLARQKAIDYPAALGYLASAPADLVSAVRGAAQHQPSPEERAEKVRAFFNNTPRPVSSTSVALRTNTGSGDVPAPPDLFAAVVKERNNRNDR